jgi:hypothetical protein
MVLLGMEDDELAASAENLETSDDNNGFIAHDERRQDVGNDGAPLGDAETAPIPPQQQKRRRVVETQSASTKGADSLKELTTDELVQKTLKDCTKVAASKVF